MGQTVDQRYVMASAVRAAYRAGEGDEALEPIVLVSGKGEPVGRIGDGDYVIFYDIRGEREIELTRSFTDVSFDEFPRKQMQVHFVTMIEYDKGLAVRVAFPPLGEMRGTLSEVVSGHGLRQVKIAESEKAIHVGFFLNGKKEAPLPGEERIIIPSPHVADYAQAPEMSAVAVAQATIESLRDEGHDLIVTNFANVDVVGHIENEAA
ncbi:MAG: phosphoglycerate mutase (2,3-diphosphoglycerate-independent), partial [Anaerolineae bacterium]